MLKLIIIGIFIYLWFKLVRTWRPLGGPRRPRNFEDTSPAGSIDDIMVQDPVCKVYIAKRNAHKEMVDGTPYYFCSTQCRDAFKASPSKYKTE